MKKALIALVVVLVAGLAVFMTACPCGPVPGAWLLGEQASMPVEDWSFVNDRNSVPLCQVEITTWRAHSINLNCMANDGTLYVSCSNCASKTWSQDALQHPAGRIRADGTVYPVTLRRVTDAAELDTAWAARLQKIQSDPAPRPDHWWSFQLSSR